MARKALWGMVTGGVAAVALAGAIAVAVPAAAETGGQAIAAGQTALGSGVVPERTLRLTCTSQREKDPHQLL